MTYTSLLIHERLLMLSTCFIGELNHSCPIVESSCIEGVEESILFVPFFLVHLMNNPYEKCKYHGSVAMPVCLVVSFKCVHGSLSFDSLFLFPLVMYCVYLDCRMG